MSEKTPSLEDSRARVAELQGTLQSFHTNAASVIRLLNFDSEVVHIALSGVRALHETLLRAGFQNAALNAHNTLRSLENIKTNDSLEPRYRVIFNQAVVLLVSYFGSALQEMFKIGVAARLRLDDDSSMLMKEELKLTFRKIRERGWMLNDIAADLLVDKKDLTFQDMKSVADAFNDYVGVRIPRDQNVNDIIVAQACRHVIVHAGHQVTPKMLHQLRDATPRALKPDLIVGEVVQFTPSEVELVSSSMKVYVNALVDNLSTRI
jgi:hypothetical protein